MHVSTDWLMHVSMDVSYNCIRGIRSILCPKYEHKLKWRRTSTEPASYQKCNSGQVSFIQHPRVLHVCITWVGNSCCFWQSQYSLKPMKRVANWLLKVCQQRIAHKPIYSLIHFMPLISFDTSLKTSENLWFSGVFRRYQKRSVA